MTDFYVILSLGSGDHTYFSEEVHLAEHGFASLERSLVTVLVRGDWLLQQCRVLSSPGRCSRNSCGVDKDCGRQMGSSEALQSSSVTLVMRKLCWGQLSSDDDI